MQTLQTSATSSDPGSEALGTLHFLTGPDASNCWQIVKSAYQYKSLCIQSSLSPELRTTCSQMFLHPYLHAFTNTCWLDEADLNQQGTRHPPEEQHSVSVLPLSAF